VWICDTQVFWKHIIEIDSTATKNGPGIEALTDDPEL
jgi:hypothetical protein